MLDTPTRRDDHVEATPPAPEPTYSTKFKPYIEGLRSVAVLPVLLFHASLPFAPGGFIGVDIFFVISGFLITGLMAAELQNTGRVRLVRFYARRARRILPSASLVLAATAIAAWLILPPLTMHTVAGDLVSAALYITNWHFIASNTNYLAPTTDNSPILHYWSLAVEEQFYLVWPGVFALVAFAFRKRWPDVARPFRTLLAVFGLATLVSFAIGLRQTANAPTTAYLSTFARAWEFGVGACLVLVLPHLARFDTLRKVSALIGWAGLIAIIWSVIGFDNRTPFPGVAALLPVLGTAAIFFSGDLHGSSRLNVARLLSTAPLRAIGRLSFAWYLWHWPVLIFGEAYLHWSEPWQKFVLVAASALPALISLKLIENPIRMSRALSSQSSRGLAIGALATVLTLTAGLLLDAQSSPSPSTQLGSSTPALTFESAFGNGPESQRNSGAVTPTPEAADLDVPPQACILEVRIASGPDCWKGVPGSPTVVLFGDSHAHQWLPAVEDIAMKQGWSVLVLTKEGCPAADIPPEITPGAWFGYPDCIKWRQASLDRITQMHPALVITSSSNRDYTNDADLLSAWNPTLSRIRSAAIPIAYIVDTPFPVPAPTPCMSGSLDNWSACSFSEAKAVVHDPIPDEVRSGRLSGITTIALDQYLCANTKCFAAHGGVLIYRHETHLTATAAHLLGVPMQEDLKKANLLKLKN